jgi:uncharacterized protein YkwD
MRVSCSFGVIALASLLAHSCSKDAGTPSTPSSGSPTTSTPTEAALEQQTHAKINDYRASKGLATLTWNDVIAEQARQHSKNMANGSVAFGHDGFSARTDAIGKTIPLAGAAENVAMTSVVSDPPSTIVNEWINSSGHKANIEGSYNLTGIGVARASNGAVYFTQIFIKSR